jgi:hypothetical protein
VAREVSDLIIEPYGAGALARAVASAGAARAVLTEDHRRSLSARFRAVPDPGHRRLDAWTVETAGRPGTGFAWTPGAARRSLATAALRRAGAAARGDLLEAARGAIEDEVARARTGQTRAGSLGRWLDEVGAPVRALVLSEALNWAGAVAEVAHALDAPWTVPAADAYYDVAGARTTLRGRRDLESVAAGGRVVVRLRAGSPAPTAGAGLRADLVVLALADPGGVSPLRVVGVWPEAGVILSVDGTMPDLRAGARSLVRAAVVARRHRLVLAA